MDNYICKPPDIGILKEIIQEVIPGCEMKRLNPELN
jgi:hypothetical protein